MRDVTPDAWGKALLEEILFRGGRQVSEEAPSPSLEVTITVRITADAANDRIEIAVPSITDGELVTHLPRPS